MPDINFIRESVITLLECGDNFGHMKQAVDKMYDIFSRTTGVTIQNLNQDKDIMLPSGKALGMAGAAHCLLEMKRTATFLRAINNAILQKKQEKKGSQLQLFYAGTGPYGTLVIPLLLLYNPEEIKVDLLDINQDSLTALQKIIKTFSLGKHIGDIYCADATTISLKHQYDIVISETMQACLKNEPQVAISQNLIPQCQADTIFIPEQITIDAYLKKRGIWDGDQLIEEGGETNHLCEIFTVNKTNLDSSNYRKVVTLPQTFGKPYDLLLYTTIKVFDKEVLGLNDCSLNIPQRYFELRGNHQKSIEFYYKQSNKPKIEFKILDYLT